MIELIEFIVSKLVDNPEDVSITCQDGDDIVNVYITVNKDDMGKIIGKQGRIAKAIRTVVKGASAKSGIKYNIEIRDAE